MTSQALEETPREGARSDHEPVLLATAVNPAADAFVIRLTPAVISSADQRARIMPGVLALPHRARSCWRLARRITLRVLALPHHAQSVEPDLLLDRTVDDASRVAHPEGTASRSHVGKPTK